MKMERLHKCQLAIMDTKMLLNSTFNHFFEGVKKTAIQPTFLFNAQSIVGELNARSIENYRWKIFGSEKKGVAKRVIVSLLDLLSTKKSKEHRRQQQQQPTCLNNYLCTSTPNELQTPPL